MLRTYVKSYIIRNVVILRLRIKCRPPGEYYDQCYKFHKACTFEHYKRDLTSNVSYMRRCLNSSQLVNYTYMYINNLIGQLPENMVSNNNIKMLRKVRKTELKILFII